MPGMTERIYPKEMRSSSAIEILWKEVHLRRYALARDWLRKHFGGRTIRTIDIACGCGYGSEILSELGPVVGVDIDPDAIEYARLHHSNARTTYLAGNGDDPGFLVGLGSFDAVVSSGTVEHVADADSYVSWVRRALEPGGACVLCFPCVLTMDWASPHHKRDISTQEARRLFSRCGLEVVEEYHERHRLSMRDLLFEKRTNPELPVPPLRRWIWYYLRHPHHLAVRLFQMSPLGKGILFGDQEYLLVPAAVAGSP